MSEISFSIITVCLNAEKQIRKTIESVLSQTYNGTIEYIIIDGESTDGTTEIVKEYIDRLGVFISEKDTGIYNAINKGIRLAHGDIIGILNSGDWYEENTLQLVADAAAKGTEDILYGTTRKWDGATEKGCFDIYPLEKFWYLMAFPHPSTFVRRSCYDKYGLFDESYRIAADYKWLLGSYLEGATFRQIEAVLTNFMLDGVSETRLVETVTEARRVSFGYAEKFEVPDGIDALERYYEKALRNAKAREMRRYHEDITCDIINEAFPNKVDIVVWGACDGVGDVIDLLARAGHHVVGLVDNNPSKAGTEMLGLPVSSPEAGLRDGNNGVFIFVTGHDLEIERQISEMDVFNGDYMTLDQLKAELVNFYDMENTCVDGGQS